MRRTVLRVSIFAAGCLCAAAPGGTREPVGGEKPALWTYQDFLDRKIPLPYTIRKDHPRLLITAENKAEIIEKIAAAPKIWRDVIADAEKGAGEDAVLACGAIYQLGLVGGFRYALDRDAYAAKGVAELMRLPIADAPDRPGACLLGGPCGYDWLFDRLSARQKAELVKRMVALAPKVEATFNGPGGRGMLLGIAFHGDGVDDEAAESIVQHYWRNVWWNPRGDGHNIVALMLYTPTGGYVEGLSYFPRNYPIYPTMAAWKTATGQDYFSRLGYFRAVPYWLVHALVPRPEAVKGPFLALSLHSYQGAYNGSTMWHPTIDNMAAAATGYLSKTDPAGAALARWYLDRGRAGAEGGLREMKLVFGLLIGDPRVKPASPAELGVAKTLVLEGVNDVFMRSAWSDPDATVVGFANTRFGCIRASAINTFSLWKNRGGLLLYRGHIAGHDYAGDGGWFYNSPVFYEGPERLGQWRSSSMTGGAAGAIGSRWDIGTFARAAEADEFDYLRGSCRALRRGLSEVVRLKRYERTLVYLRPTGEDRSTGLATGKTDHVLLLDRLDTGAEALSAHVVFNTVFEPQIGADWRGAGEGKVVLPGQWSYERAPCVVVTNEYKYPEGCGGQAHARAFVKTLFPQAIRTLKVGGKDHFADRLDGKGSETIRFESFRKTGGSAIAGGWWRFHVVPTGPRNAHTVLTAIEATDSKVQQPGPMELLEGEGILGAQAGPGVVLFSKDGGTLSAGTVKAAAPAARVLVADLKPGAGYALAAGGKSLRLTASDAGTIFAKGLALRPGDVVTVSRAGP